MQFPIVYYTDSWLWLMQNQLSLNVWGNIPFPFHPLSNDWEETTFQKKSYWGKIHLGVLDNPKNTISNENTITEFVYIPDECRDGKFFLNLNIANFNLDAAPSRPTLYPI